jgi:AcrR family transcriptional regulator
MLPLSTPEEKLMKNTDDTLRSQAQDQEKPYHHGDLWHALVQSGIEILHEEGLHALTLRAVARRAGVSHAAPYRHFTDKDALLAAIAEDGYRRLADGLAEVLASADADAYQLLRDAGRRYVHFVLENPDHVRVMFSGLFGDYDKYPGLCEASNQAFALLVEIITRLQHADGLEAGNPFQQSLAAWSMVHGLATLLMENSFPPELRESIDVDTLTDFCASVVFRGLRA